MSITFPKQRGTLRIIKELHHRFVLDDFGGKQLDYRRRIAVASRSLWALQVETTGLTEVCYMIIDPMGYGVCSDELEPYMQYR